MNVCFVFINILDVVFYDYYCEFSVLDVRGDLKGLNEIKFFCVSYK